MKESTINTEIKLAEEVLLKAGALQSAIFNSANFSSIATDAKGVIQIFNVGAERMLGYTAAEVMNTITPADISDPLEVIARAKTLSIELETPITPGFEALVFKASRGIEDIYELTYIRKDGSRFPAVVSVTALRDDQNTIIGYLLIGTDNTARKQIEAEQKQLGQRLRDHQFYTRSLFESNIDALMTTDPFGIITDVNKQMEALTDCSRDELIGSPFKKYFTDPERAERSIKLVLTEKKVINYELTARNRDGKETVVSLNATTFYDRDRILQGVFAAARDVTERIELENVLKTSLAEKEMLLREVHHRVKNNLAVIIGLIDMQSQLLEDPKTRATLTSLIGRINSMSLVHEKLYRSDSLVRINFQDYVETLGSHLRRSIGLNYITYQVAAQKVDVPLDIAIPCGMIINELMTNALKYAFPEGKPRLGNDTCLIEVTITRDNATYSLSVADNGVGLPPGFDWLKSPTLGVTLIRMLGQHQLGGRYELDQSEGTRWTLTFTTRKGEKA